jgi:hypothetical protein
VFGSIESGASLSQGLDAQSINLAPIAASVSQARHFVVELARRFSLEEVEDSAALCASELATNAILHTRDHFVVTARRAGLGIRVDVQDACPDQLPLLTPDHGSVVDLTTLGTSGRGLQIVAALATRWGVFTTAIAKTVWAEISGGGSTDTTSPVVELRHHAATEAQPITFVFLDLPVRAAVASGIQVDELVRELQLDTEGSLGPDEPTIARLFDLLDRSASIRLAGRHGALRAAAEGRYRFDMSLSTSLNALRAMSELPQLLASLSRDHHPSIPPLPDDVMAFRAWLNDEMGRQRSGSPPVSCPL